MWDSLARIWRPARGIKNSFISMMFFNLHNLDLSFPNFQQIKAKVSFLRQQLRLWFYSFLFHIPKGKSKAVLSWELELQLDYGMLLAVRRHQITFANSGQRECHLLLLQNRFPWPRVPKAGTEPPGQTLASK